MNVREARIDDYLSIAKICCEDLGYACEDSLVKSQLSKLDKNRDCVFVAEEDNQVIGFVHVERYDTLYMATLANVLGLAVSSHYRNIGAGRALMWAAEDWAKCIGAAGVRLNSGASRSEAHKFYRKVGYNSEKNQVRFLKMF